MRHPRQRDYRADCARCTTDRPLQRLNRRRPWWWPFGQVA